MHGEPNASLLRPLKLAASSGLIDDLSARFLSYSMAPPALQTFLVADPATFYAAAAPSGFRRRPSIASYPEPG
jgi:hypothetical protein